MVALANTVLNVLVALPMFPEILPVVTILPAVIVPVPTDKLPPVILPVALTRPSVKMLPPITLPVALAWPLVTILLPEILSALVIVDVAEINPAVKILPGVELPIVVKLPYIVASTGVTINTGDTPPTLIEMSPPLEPTNTFELPFCIVLVGGNPES